MPVIMKMMGVGSVFAIDSFYLRSCNHEAHDGRGEIKLTTKRDDAMRFADMAAGFEFWTRQSTTRPLRPDGKPNKPLTAYTVEFIQL